MQVLALGAMAVGPAAGALALDKGAGEHLAESAEAANEASAGWEVGVAWHFYMALITVRAKLNQGLFEKCKNDQTGGRLENAS